VQVEIWSDIACPWCYVGKRRFEAALAAFEGREEVTVRWRAFELDPDAEREREADLASELAAKYGITREEALARRAQLVAVAAGEGIAMAPASTRSSNTFDGHRLLALAAHDGRQDALKERLLRAHHCEGESVGNRATLERLAIEVGLDGEAVREVLAGERFAQEVRADEATARALGIDAVPFFVIDRAYGAAGAQSPEVLGQFLRHAYTAAATPATGSGG